MAVSTPSANSNELVLRCQLESYMECGESGAKTFNLISEGFTTFSESKNPKEYSRKYVGDKTERSDVISYTPSISYNCDVITGDPCVAEVIKVTDNELVGTDAHRDVVSVNTWETDSDGKCKAFKRTYAIIPDGKGDGTDALIYTGTMKAVSDVVFGKFDRTTKTFTADSAS